MSTKYSDFTLEQFVLNELANDIGEQLKADIETDAVLRQRIAAIHESNSAIAQQHDQQAIVREIELRIKNRQIHRHSPAPDRQRRVLWPRLAYALPIVAVVTLSSVFMVDYTSHNSEQVAVSKDGVRIKGMQPHINVYQKSHNGITLLRDRAAVSKGDTLQLSYFAAGNRYGMIFSIDGQGVVTLHYPYTENADAQLQTSGEIALERAYELDNAPRFEKFYFISAKQAFSVVGILESVRSYAASNHDVAEKIPNLPGDLQQSQHTLLKVQQ